MRYRIKSPPVVAETLDGEATIVDLDSGTYYALNESGTLIWDEIARGQTPAQVAGRVAETYSIDADASSAAVEGLVAELLERELIVSLAEGEQPPPAPESGNGAPVLRRYDGGFRQPQLNAFTDMQELLLLDPVHEVDDDGWPNPK